jgi:Domain of unknown function (DUF4037)
VPGSGAELAAEFFRVEVRAAVERAAPGLRYLAGRLGSGSDVLGFDDIRSRDHDFGCRMTLLVDDSDAVWTTKLDRVLEESLPATFGGHRVRFATTWDVRIGHKVEIATVADFAHSRLGVDVSGDVDAVDWLSLPGQAILEVVAGPVFHDTTLSYGPLAAQLMWYPPDVWRYVLASGLRRLGQELPLVGRTAERGDDLGSRIITARLVRGLVKLAFLLERTWAPYPKWTGSALQQLPTAAVLVPLLEGAVQANSWKDRQRDVCLSAELLARRQSELGLPVPNAVTQPFFDRPFMTINPEITDSLTSLIGDPAVAALPAGVGSIEQWSDNVDLFTHPERSSAIQSLYRQLIASASGKQ